MAGGEGIIRRKVAAARAEAAAGGPGADRGWRLALARAARDKLKTTLDFRSLTLDRRSLGEVVELAPDRAFIAVLDGPREGLGVMMLAPSVLSAMIEAQTIGRVKGGDVPLRKPTRTDAAMVAGVIDTALRGLEQALAEEADLIWAGGFRYASFLEEARPLGLLLEDTTYRLLRAEIDLAGGARQGEVILALPAEGRGPSPGVKAGEERGPDQAHQFVQLLADRVNGAQSGLEAVLARLKMPLAEVMSLETGMILPLPQAGLDRISLEGLDGRKVAEGRLGQNRGLRAIRLGEGAALAGGAAVAADMMPTDLGAMGMAPTEEADFGGFGGGEIDMDFAATGTE